MRHLVLCCINVAAATSTVPLDDPVCAATIVVSALYTAAATAASPIALIAPPFGRVVAGVVDPTANIADSSRVTV